MDLMGRMSIYMKSILFICTGNTCRSPMAKVIAEDVFKKQGLEIEVHSAGINVLSLSNASQNAMEVARKRNLDLSEHLSQQAAEIDYDGADLILTMTEGHKRYLLESAPHIGDKVFSLIDYVTGQAGDIEDPFGYDVQEYEACFESIESFIISLAEKLAATREQKGE